MKTVQDYRNLGLVFVCGDKCFKNGASGDEFHRNWHESPAMYSDKIASSFAWRNNDGVNPDYKGDVEIMDGEHNTGIRKASKVNWAMNPYAGDANICKWRPVVLQSESPTVSSKEGKTMKPVYTAEMHAKGERPQVGSEVALRYKFDSKQIHIIGKVLYASMEHCIINGEHKECHYKMCDYTYEPIIKTINVNGFDVPAPMSEAPEGGSEYFVIDILSDSLVSSIEWEGDDKDNQWLSKGIIHSTKSAAIAHAKAMLGIDPNA